MSKLFSAEPDAEAIHFRVDAGAGVGAGHLKRCLYLAAAARKVGTKVRFTIYGDRESAVLARADGYEVTLRAACDFAAQAKQVDELAHDGEIAVLDFIHAGAFAEVGATAKLVRAWKAASGCAVLIDGAAGQALRAHERSLAADVVVAPYAGESADGTEPYRLLAGAQYAILSRGYRRLPARNVRASANRVLVSCGGADPFELSVTVLRALENVPAALEVRVIVGPMFKDGLRSAITQLARQSRHDIELVSTPSDLAKHMLWADAAVCTSGLVKYELAATGTPALLIAIDEPHLQADGPFVEHGTARHMGTRDSLESGPLAEALARLLGDANARQQMAMRGQALVDGLGADRVMAAVLPIAACGPRGR